MSNFTYFLFFIAALTVKCLYFQYTTGLSTGPLNSPVNLYMLEISIGVLLIVLSAVTLLFGVKKKISLLILNLIFSVVLFGDTLYFRYYSNAITIPVLLQFGLAGSVGESMANLFKFKDVVYLADFPFLIAGLFFFKSPSNPLNFKTLLVRRIILSVFLAAAGLTGFYYGYSNAWKGAFPYDNNYVVNNAGILYFHYYDTKRYISENLFTDKTLSREEKKLLEEYYANKAAGGKKLNGISKGMNLMVVQVEAFQQFVINRRFNNQEITPNLNKFIKESLYFDNFYYQTGGGNTSDAEFLTNTSLYPLKEGAIYFRYPVNEYHSLPKALKEQGYTTYVFHANNPSFWNRTEMYKAVGFDHFISSGDFNTDEVLGWGLSDVSFFRQALDKIDTGKPFYSFLVTLSSHHPFNYFENYEAFNAGKYEKTFFGNYLKAAHYADAALGGLIDGLKNRGLYDNTVLVIYGDHFGIQKDQAEVLGEFLDQTTGEPQWTQLQKVPCFIHYPGLEEGKTLHTVGGQIDILPTTANLMGFECPFALGKDLLNCEKGYAVLRNSSVVTDEYIYINDSKAFYDQNGNMLNGGKSPAGFEKLQNELNISDIIIKKDAFSQNSQ